ncbi:hypothetical protein ISF76_28870 [Burkholderia pseudomallei]|nr:hypothetical protein [Burkholderia pseudomallei]
MDHAASVEVQLTGRCTTPGCNAPADRCIEDLSPEECPNFVVGPEPGDASLATGATAGQQKVVQIGRGGAALSINDADVRMLSTPVGRRLGVVALVGVPDCGKTTLLSSLYEVVRRDARSHLGFAGSETIRGFEERCHLSRLASENEIPDTPRTASELQFLHLSLVARQSGERVELFMADRRGEQFQDVLDRPELAEDLAEVRRGDGVALLLDGGHLVDAQRRELAIAMVQRLAMAICGHLREFAAVQLVVTKVDKIREHADESTVRTRVDALSSRLSAMFGSAIRYSLHYVAARDLEGGDNGLSQLLCEWLVPPKRIAPDAAALPLGKTPFERLMNLRGI